MKCDVLLAAAVALPGTPFRRVPLSVLGHVYTTMGQPMRNTLITASQKANLSAGGVGFTRKDQFGTYKLELTYGGPEDISAQAKVFQS